MEIVRPVVAEEAGPSMNPSNEIPFEVGAVSAAGQVPQKAAASPIPMNRVQ
jgi:hypothetical protein